MANPYEEILQSGGEAPNPYMDLQPADNPYLALIPKESSKSPAVSDSSASPDYGTVVSGAASKGFHEGVKEVGDFFSAAAAKVQGRPFFTEGPRIEEIPTEVDPLLQTRMSEGWTNPKWWIAQGVYGAAKSIPQTAAMVGGGVLGGPAGAGIAGGTTETAMRVLPAFREAKARGLSDEDAITEAATVAAVSGGTVAIMGAAGMTPMLGTTLSARSNGVVSEALKHPIREALLQLGLIQPTIGAAGVIATGAAKEQDVSPMEVVESAAIGTMTMAPFVGVQVAAAGSGRMRPAARPEVVGKAFERPASEAIPPLEGEIIPPTKPLTPFDMGPPVPDPSERIVAAGARYGDRLFTGILHPDAHEAAKAALGKDAGVGESGFLTSTGRFVDRREAMEIANRQQQIEPTMEALARGEKELSADVLGGWRDQDVKQFTNVVAEAEARRNSTWKEEPDGGLSTLDGATKIAVTEDGSATVTSAKRQRTFGSVEEAIAVETPREGPIRQVLSDGTVTRVGLPRLDTTPLELPKTRVIGTAGSDDPLFAAHQQAAKVFEQMHKRMGIDLPLDIRLINDPNLTGSGGLGRLQGQARNASNGGRYEIMSNRGYFKTAEDVYRNLAHEFGHVVLFWAERTAPHDTTQRLHNEFSVWRARIGSLTGKTTREVLDRRDNAIRVWSETQITAPWKEEPFLAQSPEMQRYWMNFHEWFAEQTARWATTSQKPLSIVDKFFSSLGRKIREIVDIVVKKFGRSFSAEAEVAKWLDSTLNTVDLQFGADKFAQMQIDTLRANRAALDREGSPHVAAEPATPSTISGGTILNNAGAGDAGRAWKAHADRFNKFYGIALGLPQIAARNLHIKPLQLFNEVARIMNTVKNNIWDMGMEVGRTWKHLSATESHALGGFIDDYMNGRFMSAKEWAKGRRLPTPEEAKALAAKHKLTERGFAQFQKIQEYFRLSNERFRGAALRDTQRILDPIEQANAIKRVNEEYDRRATQPYMPAMRWGQYTVEGKNAAGDKVHFERYESLRRRKLALAELKRLYPDVEWSPGYLAKDAMPMAGMPRAFLDKIAEKMSLSPTQQAHLVDLKLETAPDQSFVHRFQKKELTPGYSQDWQRAFANYSFHEGNYFARMQHVDQLRELIRAVRDERHTREDPTKVIKISNYLSEWIRMEFDPKSDWAALRSIAFPWYLGYVVRAAALNTTQVPVISWPHLASKFGGAGIGDARSAAALVRAMTSYNTYWRKATLEGTNSRELRGIREAINDAILAESQGSMLAAVGEGRNLLKGFGSSSEKAWQSFNEWGAVMFQGAEHWNRVVTFKAAWELALAHPESPYIKEAIQKHGVKYNELLEKGWSKQDAGAFVAARDSVETTQFIYSPYARPKMMQGKLGAVLVFKSFTMNSLFNLWNNPSAAARTIAILAGTAGLSGIPFAEDINSLVKGLSARLFGKDFDLDSEVRKFVVDHAEGKISPDLLLHGASRSGFGVPQVAEMMGSLTGVKLPVPSVDMSSAIGMGQLLPMDVGKLITPRKDTAGPAMREIQRASGAIFGLGFNLYNFATSDPFTSPDAKKWEQIMPSALRNASQAFRWYREEMEKNKLGNPVIRFDPHDTVHMAEILAKGVGGFQPTRLSQRYENIMQKAEAIQYFAYRREILMKQFMSAIKDRDPEKLESMRQAVRQYNEQIPDEFKEKRITGDQIRQSLVARTKTQVLQEKGLPSSKRDIGIYREIDRLYPEGAPEDLVGVRRVR